MRRRIASLLCALAGGPLHAANDACIDPAALYHQVSPQILRAILTVESGMRPNAVNRNGNGSIDVGIAQINSIHFSALAKYGIAPEHLMDACIGTYVAAWHLKKQVLAYGNTWFAVGAYHSVTPVHNLRYQNLVYKQVMRDAGAGHVAQTEPPSRAERQARADAAIEHDTLTFIKANE